MSDHQPPHSWQIFLLEVYINLERSLLLTSLTWKSTLARTLNPYTMKMAFESPLQPPPPPSGGRMGKIKSRTKGTEGKRYRQGDNEAVEREREERLIVDAQTTGTKRISPATKMAYQGRQRENRELGIVLLVHASSAYGTVLPKQPLAACSTAKLFYHPRIR